MTALLLPGQGSQYIGMSEDFYNNFLNSKLVFEEVEDSTSIDVKKIIFADPLNQLNLTNYTQLCVFTASYSIFYATIALILVNLVNKLFTLRKESNFKKTLKKLEIAKA